VAQAGRRFQLRNDLKADRELPLGRRLFADIYDMEVVRLLAPDALWPIGLHNESSRCCAKVKAKKSAAAVGATLPVAASCRVAFDQGREKTEELEWRTCA
jgi:hypothetical protein